MKSDIFAADWIVDALLGTGAHGEPRPPFDAAIDWMNVKRAKKLAVDVPSGLDCDSGEPAKHTVRADHTCTFAAMKIGFTRPAAKRTWAKFTFAILACRRKSFAVRRRKNNPRRIAGGLNGFCYSNFVRALGVELYAWVIGDVDPHVDVRCAAVVPHEGRAFDSPDVPDAIFADVVLGVVREVATFEAALGFEALGDFVAIALAVRLDEHRHDFLQMLFLVARQFANGQALEVAAFAAEGDFLFGRQTFFEERLLLLFAIEHLVQLVGGFGLRPEDIAGMGWAFVEAVGGVAVEDRAAEGDVVGGVAVATDGHVPAGHHEFELLAAGMAKNGDAVVRAVAFGVVGELLIDPRVPFGVDDSLEDAADDVLLIFVVKIAGDELVGDVPIVGDTGSQQATLGVFEVPGETHGFALAGREGVVEDFYERLGRRCRRRLPQLRLRSRSSLVPKRGRLAGDRRLRRHPRRRHRQLEIRGVGGDDQRARRGSNRTPRWFWGAADWFGVWRSMTDPFFPTECLKRGRPACIRTESRGESKVSANAGDWLGGSLALPLLFLAGWAEEGRPLSLDNAADFAAGAAAGARIAGPIVNAVVILVAAFFIEGIAVGAVAERGAFVADGGFEDGLSGVGNGLPLGASDFVATACGMDSAQVEDFGRV